MKINDMIHGFRVKRIREVPDISGTLFEFEHEKTGARLAWMNNSEENKLFSVAFKTIPFDDTGVFHILEHSVLGGSKKYPVKEPFLEMLKSSMNTFLNALTFPDMTVFPVSSRNDTDLMNLVSVYMDAVFCPSIYTERRIFEQEGWHIELREKDDEPSYKGVVFNEMKGALSSVNTRITTELSRLLYPDVTYRFESGGDPVSIPDLTYEKFIETHRKFYSPSNAYFYIDGPVDIETMLAFIDSGYLSSFDRTEDAGEIPLQSPVAPVTKRLEYDLSADEDIEGNAYLVFGKVLGTYKEVEKSYAVSAVSEALGGSNESPLKRALLDTGHCLDFSMGLMDGLLQSFGILEVMNTDEQYVEELSSVITATTNEIIASGIDKDALISAIDRMEFRYIEGSEPKGLDRDLNALVSWIHGGDPLTYLDCKNVFDKLRKLTETDYYEKLLKEWLIDEEGRVRLVMVPSHEYAAKQNEAENDRVKKTVSALSEEEKRALIEENLRLDEWQKEPSSPEDIAGLPALSLSEVSDMPLKYETFVDETFGVTVLRHPAKEKGIVSLSLYFDVRDLSPDEIYMLKLAASVMGEIPTRERSALALRQKINSVFGDFYVTVDAYARDGVTQSCKPYFIARCSFLENKRDEAYGLLLEIMTETLFIPELIGEQFSQMQENFKQGIISRGSSYAARRVLAPSSALSSFLELTCGYEAYTRLCALNDRYDREGSGVSETLRYLVEKACEVSRLTVGITSFDSIGVEDIVKGFEIGSCADANEFSYRIELPPLSGIIIPSRISFTAQGFNSPVSDIPAWRVISTVLSLEYLWNEIRVRGGAYGAGASVNALGMLGFNSYRDPDAANSFKAYSGVSGFLDRFLSELPSLDKYIIGTISKQEPLISDPSRGVGADELYFRGIDEAERIKNRRKTLSLSVADLQNVTGDLSGAFSRCVVGNENTVRAFERDGIVISSL